jgi:hypothetical protein
MDPTNDIHYELDGRPLGGRELAQAAWRGRWQGIVKVGSDASRTPVTPEELRSWRDYSIVMRNNHLSQPVLIEQGGRLQALTHRADFRDYPMTGKDEVVWGGELLGWRPPGRMAQAPAAIKLTSDDAADFRNAYDQTIIVLVEKDAEQGTVKLKLLSDHSPEFQSFLVRAGGPEFESPLAGSVLLVLHPGLNALSARVKTRFGWLGPESSIELFYKPAWRGRKKTPPLDIP